MAADRLAEEARLAVSLLVLAGTKILADAVYLTTREPIRGLFYGDTGE